MFVDIDPDAINPGESLVLYPMIKRRHNPDADWMTMDSKAFFVQAGRTEDGELHMECVKPSHKQTKMQIVGVKLFPESGFLGATNNLILTIRNDEETERIRALDLFPYYYGDIKAENITDDTPYTEGKEVWTGVLLRMGEEAQVTFCFVPQQNGTVVFKVYAVDVYAENLYVGDCVVEINAPNAITSMEDGRSMMEDEWYDLQGRKLEGKPTQPGVYIYNGKKIVVNI